MAQQQYHIRRIRFLNREVGILLQAENGPCPLLAICNVLLLRNQLEIHPDEGSISFGRLVTLLANQLFEANPQLLQSPGQEPSSPNKGAIVANQRQQLDDAIGLLSVLERGLDVNVQFTGQASSSSDGRTSSEAGGGTVTGFEYTKEFSPFDLLDIDLVHELRRLQLLAQRALHLGGGFGELECSGQL